MGVVAGESRIDQSARDVADGVPGVAGVSRKMETDFPAASAGRRHAPSAAMGGSTETLTLPRHMDRTGTLALLNRKILEEYSRRTTLALRATLPLRIALPHLEPVLARNVAKEMQKDALVIRHAGEALAAGSSQGRGALGRLLEATKEIDRAFLTQVGRLPIRIVIPYAEITPLRLERIERLHGAAYRILAAWQPAHGVRATVQTAYQRAEFERLLSGLLRLYAQETRVLSRAVRLPMPLIPMRERLAQNLHRIMSDTATQLAGKLAAMVYRR